MKLFYTEQAIRSLQESLDILPPEVSMKKRLEIRDKILTKADKLLTNPSLGQKEEYLDHFRTFPSTNYRRSL